jgi:hypothetical protein
VVHCVPASLLIIEGKDKMPLLGLFDLSEHLDDLLERDPKDKRISINSLVTSLITRYAEWDRYIEKIGFISLPREVIKLVVDSIDDEKIRQLAEGFGSRHGEEYMMFWSKRLSPDMFLDQLALFCRYAGLARYEIYSDEGDHVIVLHHELGRKWSIFLSHKLTQVMKNTIKVIPRFDITEHSVVLKFFIP